MGFLLFVVFLSVPIIEIWVLIKVGGLIGAGWTVALVVATAICGAALVRRQGLSVMNQMRSDMQSNVFPIASVFDGACLLVAGAMLLTPGFMTDAIGLFLLLPPFRRLLQAYLMARVQVVGASAGVKSRPSPGHHTGGGIIDGEFEDVTGREHTDEKARKIEGPQD